ncbi:unnamed protein product, partial [Symbiodinium sp. KB8]
VGLAFMRGLCAPHGKAPAWAHTAASVQFTILPLINRWGHDEVHKGHFCLRTNANDVDINRNWDAHWRPAQDGDPAQTGPGSGPFSEAETVAMRDAMTQAKPHLFVTVHSGAVGMYTPYAHSPKDVLEATAEEEKQANADAQRFRAAAGMLRGGKGGDEPDSAEATAARERVAKAASRHRRAVAMSSTLKQLASEFGTCPHGSAGHELGYLCPGTCLDYAWDVLDVPLTYAYEVWDLEARGNRGAGPWAGTGRVEDTDERRMTMFASALLGAEAQRGGPPSDGEEAAGQGGDGVGQARFQTEEEQDGAGGADAWMGTGGGLPDDVGGLVARAREDGLDGASDNGRPGAVWGGLAEAGNAASTQPVLGILPTATALERAMTGLHPGEYVLPDAVSQSLLQAAAEPAGPEHQAAVAEHSRATSAHGAARAHLEQLHARHQQSTAQSAALAQRISALQAGINEDRAKELAAMRASLMPEVAAGMQVDTLAPAPMPSPEQLSGVALLQAGSLAAGGRRRRAFADASVALEQAFAADGQEGATSAEAKTLEDERCIAQFNPLVKGDFDAVVERWTAVLASTAAQAHRAVSAKSL